MVVGVAVGDDVVGALDVGKTVGTPEGAVEGQITDTVYLPSANSKPSTTKM